jgi:hypothetical protein
LVRTLYKPGQRAVAENARIRDCHSLHVRRSGISSIQRTASGRLVSQCAFETHS